MYLRDLTYDEKQAYIKLALLIISADNEISQKELNILELQNKEMGDFELPSFSELEYIDIHELLKDSENATYRKIYFELLLIAYSDALDTTEGALVEKVRLALGISKEESAKFEVCAKTISDTYYVLDKIINNIRED